MNVLYVGIDNGVTGWVAALAPATGQLVFRGPVPTVKVAKETKSGGFETHVDAAKLEELLARLRCTYGNLETRVKIIYERPMINPGRWTATMSAVRADEVLRVVLDRLSLPRVRVDSRQWQSVFCPGVKGPALKKASRDAAIRLFPEWKAELEKAADGDAPLIAEYGRRNSL